MKVVLEPITLTEQIAPSTIPPHVVSADEVTEPTGTEGALRSVPERPDPDQLVKEEIQREFVPLFNGKDFTGWHFPLEGRRDWRVENSIIRGSGTSDASTLATVRSDYKDFHLRMDVRTSDNLNKLILVRASHSADDVKYYTFWSGILRARGQIASLGEYRLKTGGGAIDGTKATTDGLREIKASRLPGLAKETWQRVEVVASGNVFRMLVDGGEVSAFQDTESRLERGQIAIRLPKGGGIEIRDIEVKELNVHGERAEQARQVRYVSLFNGKDLTGWKDLLSNGSEWRVVEGMLEGRGAGQGGGAVLTSQRNDFRNYRLRVKFRYREEGGGGIELRRSVAGDTRSAYSVSICIWPSVDSRNRPPGNIIKLKDLRFRGFFPPVRRSELIDAGVNRWHMLEITASKNQISTSVNGKMADEYLDGKDWYRSGAVALAVRNNSVIQFQEIMIEELPD